ncbi:hypothetical protein FOPE_10735 [Fonsecaea pedrosoi]|nr:hypothetical protein FOPE_10735 [Fonsecaea pedrosoi]
MYGKEADSKIETGGERHGEEGYFIQPTVFSNVSEDMKIMQEEVFGPVCAISKFKTEEEVFRLGNETTCGLAAAVHTTNLNTTIRVANALKASTAWVNNYSMLSNQVPFDGFKEPSIGHDVLVYACVAQGIWFRLLWLLDRRPLAANVLLLLIKYQPSRMLERCRSVRLATGSGDYYPE